MTAFGTIDAREPVVQVSTFQEALDDVSGGGVRSPILRLSLQSRMGNGRPDTVTPRIVLDDFANVQHASFLPTIISVVGRGAHQAIDLQGFAALYEFIHDSAHLIRVQICPV